jgi:hypothetical protein
VIPRRFAPALFGLIVSGLMSFVVSGISTFRSTGLPQGYLATWIGAWLTAWLFAFPVVLLVGPTARRLVRRLVDSE